MNIHSRHVFHLCIIITLMVSATTAPLDDGTGAVVPDDSARVLLVSSVVDNADVLAAAAAEDVLVIRYDTESTDLEALLGLVRDALGGRKALSIGFAAHDFGEARFYLTGSETVSLSSTLASASQRAFWQELGALIEEGGRIDIFACKLVAGEQGLMLVSAIEAVSGVGVAASSDNTGNIASGGDWILETDDINLADLYFYRAELARFSGLLTSHVAKLTALDAAESDCFGASVSISGDYAVVGADSDDDAGNGSGSAYIFYRNGAGNWGQVAKLTASDAAGGDWFGFSVSISGDYAVVGAWGNDDAGTDSGSAYIFYRNQGGDDNWGQVAKLTASDAAVGDHFSWSVSISGDYAVVGADLDDDAGSGSGSAYVFVKPSSGWADMTQTAKLTASDAAGGDWFGSSVSISGDCTVVGARWNGDAGFESGAAYVFVKPSSGWADMTQTAKLTASDAAFNDNFGWSVSISGDYAVIGAEGDDSYSGSAYVFVKPSSGWADMTQTAKLTASDAAASDRFGWSVSISGDYAVVGAEGDDGYSGSAYLFVKPSSGWADMTQTAKLTASDAAVGDQFGRSVSIYGDYAVVGADHDDDAGSASGSAYVYNITTPQISNPTSTDVTCTAATLGATVDNDGCSAITERGVVWSRSANPTVTTNDGQETSAGTTGTFTVPATGLSAGTTYHFRGYATNSIGTAYTSDTTFTTSTGAPSISNPTSTNVASNSATLGATVNNNGGSALTERGVVWSASANPTVGSNEGIATSPVNVGSFTVSATGLSSDTTYHFRGFATNPVCTAYTEDDTYSTSQYSSEISS